MIFPLVSRIVIFRASIPPFLSIFQLGLPSAATAVDCIMLPILALDIAASCIFALSIAALAILALVIAALAISALVIAAFCIFAVPIVALAILALSIAAFAILALSIAALPILALEIAPFLMYASSIYTPAGTVAPLRVVSAVVTTNGIISVLPEPIENLSARTIISEKGVPLTGVEDRPNPVTYPLLSILTEYCPCNPFIEVELVCTAVVFSPTVVDSVSTAADIAESASVLV